MGTGVPKSKDYVAGQAKLVQVASMEKYHLCKVAEDGQRIEFKELVCRDDGHAVQSRKAGRSRSRCRSLER